ncbi:hypothetical protein AAFF_G00359460 [Aldrovandia affinis]|uniref:Uncharacterized protein n=1 Tax=Aldrovandia affinis TaxID=143900 RepID=A0AAD7SIK7_9TELE|nr:hypothetical protein AAFF_G00359460 [Aldrovandia affinis]
MCRRAKTSPILPRIAEPCSHTPPAGLGGQEAGDEGGQGAAGVGPVPRAGGPSSPVASVLAEGQRKLRARAHSSCARRRLRGRSLAASEAVIHHLYQAL